MPQPGQSPEGVHSADTLIGATQSSAETSIIHIEETAELKENGFAVFEIETKGCVPPNGYIYEQLGQVETEGKPSGFKVLVRDPNETLVHTLTPGLDKLDLEGWRKRGWTVVHIDGKTNTVYLARKKPEPKGATKKE